MKYCYQLIILCVAQDVKLIIYLLNNANKIHEFWLSATLKLDIASAHVKVKERDISRRNHFMIMKKFRLFFFST